jgi:hypothetical protein
MEKSDADHQGAGEAPVAAQGVWQCLGQT